MKTTHLLAQPADAGVHWNLKRRRARRSLHRPASPAVSLESGERRRLTSPRCVERSTKQAPVVWKLVALDMKGAPPVMLHCCATADGAYPLTPTLICDQLIPIPVEHHTVLRRQCYGRLGVLSLVVSLTVADSGARFHTPQPQLSYTPSLSVHLSSPSYLTPPLSPSISVLCEPPRRDRRCEGGRR